MAGWTFHTAERMQMDKWTRKRRLKFRKRWRRQHNGQSFRWCKVEFVHQPLAADAEPMDMIFHVRE